ncbi:hypothetical protein [Vulcanisaeta thermophila]|uniref:hypothetical protein n=1 Tax=Vulcanisaeta thermophila TaxID=867917 RepID=UPI000853B01C|nr:hypothetical protein [Vulcanisaeta thermophila]
MSESLVSLGLYGTLAGIGTLYGIVKYVSGVTPEDRREGLDILMDTAVGTLMYVVMWVVIMKSSLLPNLTYSIGSAFNLTNYAPLNQTQYLSSGDTLLSGTAIASKEYFNVVTQVYGNFWGIILALNMVPITSPLAWYLQNATWYWQTTIQWTIINIGFIYALSIIAGLAWALIPAASGLLILRQTRIVGTVILSLIIVSVITAPLLASLAGQALTTSGIASISSVNPAQAAENPGIFVNSILNGAMQSGLKLQSFDVTVDVVLAFAVAVAMGINRALSEVEHVIFPY